jgi:hypothetical protein
MGWERIGLRMGFQFFLQKKSSRFLEFHFLRFQLEFKSEIIPSIWYVAPQNLLQLHFFTNGAMRE